jgi:hypothetical protein
VLLSEFENAMVAKADFFDRYAAGFAASGKRAR